MASVTITSSMLTTSDLEFEITDEAFLLEFEQAWARFLHQYPKYLPQASRHDRLQQLQEKLQATIDSKEKVEAEIEQQMAFFQSSCQVLEDEYAAKMQHGIETQRQLDAELTKQLMVVARADELQQETLPWHHFMHELDRAAAASTTAQKIANNNAMTTFDSSSDDASPLNVLPSARAIAIADLASSYGSTSTDDLLYRAFQADKAILTAHVAMLEREVERFDTTLRAQELAGKFLTDNNVWSVLDKKNDGTLVEAVSEPASSEAVSVAGNHS
jgi:uncharacterized protein YdiU (UPF0061 family)